MTRPVRTSTPFSTARSRRSGAFAGAADLHIHTTHSDGACTPGEVVRAAAGLGLSALAITDHDTTSGLAGARVEADRLGLELIPGVELTCAHDGREIHLLAYFFRADDPGLTAALAGLRAARTERVGAIVARLAERGLKVDLADLRRAFPRAALGRKHLADWLVRTGQAASPRAAFADHLGEDRLGSLARPRLDAARAIALVADAGGVAAWAHPPRWAGTAAVRALADAGLGAIEVAGPGTDAARGRRLRAWAEAFGLVPTAGSDFHAPDRPGRWVGAITTPATDLERLRRAAIPSRDRPAPQAIPDP